VLVEVAVRPLRITAPFLTMKSACAIQLPFPHDGVELSFIYYVIIAIRNTLMFILTGV
jgi:hypothetical protein